MKKREWEIVHECDLEDGTPTEWVLKLDNKKYYWIDLMHDNTFNIIDHDAKTILMNCKSLKSAKRWVSMNLIKIDL